MRPYRTHQVSSSFDTRPRRLVRTAGRLGCIWHPKLIRLNDHAYSKSSDCMLPSYTEATIHSFSLHSGPPLRMTSWEPQVNRTESTERSPPPFWVVRQPWKLLSLPKRRQTPILACISPDWSRSVQPGGYPGALLVGRPRRARILDAGSDRLAFSHPRRCAVGSWLRWRFRLWSGAGLSLRRRVPGQGSGLDCWIAPPMCANGGDSLILGVGHLLPGCVPWAHRVVKARFFVGWLGSDCRGNSAISERMPRQSAPNGAPI